MRPLNAKYTTELAYQLLMQGRYQKAYSAYQEAAQIDETTSDPLLGMIRCKIFEGQIEDAEQQVEFVKTVENKIEFGNMFSKALNNAHIFNIKHPDYIKKPIGKLKKIND